MVGPNCAFGTGPAKRQWFSDFLQACGAMGQAACPLDVVSFHPFTPDAAVVREMTAFARQQTDLHLAGFNPMPQLAITAWGLHGSGMYEENANVGGAALMADMLVTMQVRKCGSRHEHVDRVRMSTDI